MILLLLTLISPELAMNAGLILVFLDACINFRLKFIVFLYPWLLLQYQNSPVHEYPHLYSHAKLDDYMQIQCRRFSGILT